MTYTKKREQERRQDKAQDRAKRKAQGRQRVGPRRYTCQQFFGRPPCPLCGLKLKNPDKATAPTKCWILGCGGPHVFELRVEEDGHRVIEEIFYNHFVVKMLLPFFHKRVTSPHRQTH